MRQDELGKEEEERQQHLKKQTNKQTRRGMGRRKNMDRKAGKVRQSRHTEG